MTLSHFLKFDSFFIQDTPIQSQSLGLQLQFISMHSLIYFDKSFLLFSYQNLSKKLSNLQMRKSQNLFQLGLSENNFDLLLFWNSLWCNFIFFLRYQSALDSYIWACSLFPHSILSSFHSSPHNEFYLITNSTRDEKNRKIFSCWPNLVAIVLKF